MNFHPFFSSTDSSLWEEAKNKARDERLTEFAPPSAYEFSQSSHKRKHFPDSESNHKKWDSKTSSHQSTSSSNAKPFQYTYPDSSNSESEIPYVPSEKGFQSFQGTKKKPKSSTATHEGNVASPSLKEKLAKLQPSASSSVPKDHRAERVEDSLTDGVHGKGSAVNEDAINQSLSFFRMQSQKK